jgi:hypothetical protein
LNPRISAVMTGAALAIGAAALSAGMFILLFAPSWPRTVWGWLISAALGLPLAVLAEVIFALCFAAGPPRYRRYVLAGTLFRVPAGTPAARTVLLLVRILAAVALCGLVLWLLHLVLGIDVVRAQFR